MTEMKRYDIMYDKKKKVGELIAQDGKYRAVRLDDEHYPLMLFGIFDPVVEAGHEQVLRFIKDRVTPPTREGMEDILRGLGMSYYDPEEFFFKTQGREMGDLFSFVKR